MKLTEFLRLEKKSMLQSLESVVNLAKRDLTTNPEEYTDMGGDDPTIAVRLCIDPWEWTFRTGLSDFDQRHSLLCAASSIGIDTTATELLEDLIEQILDQSTELEDL